MPAWACHRALDKAKCANPARNSQPEARGRIPGAQASGIPCSGFGRWTIARQLEEHVRQTNLLREHAGRVDVVIIHWPPTLHAFTPRFQGNALNGYVVNDRENLVE